jgi:23S rRNA pseudouridine955/2504/2580 synthase
MKEIIISKDEYNQRVDKFLLKYFNNASKSFIYKMLRKKRIKLNKKRINGNEILKEKDILQIYMAEETIEKFSNTIYKSLDIPITFRVIYEDDNVLICNKPVALLSQPDNSGNISLVDEVISYLVKKGEYNPELTKGFRPGICNRLDRNTSGIVIAGKNIQALQHLNNIISNHNLDKHYMCIVKGKISSKNTIEGYLSKDSTNNKVTINSNKNIGSYIKTIYNPIEIGKDITLLDVQIITGKSHQIRAHLASIGHPIIGDYKYGDKKLNDEYKNKFNLKYQLLHAYRVKFNIKDGILKYLDNKEFVSHLDGKFQKIVEVNFNEYKGSSKKLQ